MWACYPSGKLIVEIVDPKRVKRRKKVQVLASGHVGIGIEQFQASAEVENQGLSQRERSIHPNHAPIVISVDFILEVDGNRDTVFDQVEIVGQGRVK
jgi:hypothetical protein